MRSAPLSSRRHLKSTAKPRLLESLARRLVAGKLRSLRVGRLLLSEAGREQAFGQDSTEAELVSRIEVLDPRFFTEVAFGGSIGAAEAYMQGYWRCDELVALVRLLLRNRELVDGMERGTARITVPLHKLFQWVNRNTRHGAARNIASHYDLGNDFFALWLDESMMYSAAVFTRPDMNLGEAQRTRLDRICRKLRVDENDHLLEIGTGWGGFALHAAQQHGCRVTTTTISREQYDHARRRVAAAGLQDRITVLQQDFRDLQGRYDKLVSIEMIEAIGSSLYRPFFRICSRLLEPHGAMLLQAITIADQHYDSARRSVDFIKRYIFPGGCLPSSAVMAQTVAETTDMRLLDLEDIGLHYALTLRHWRERFAARIDEIRALGYTEPFIRMWEFYFCYSEGAFLERAISDLQIVFCKPDSRLTAGCRP